MTATVSFFLMEFSAFLSNAATGMAGFVIPLILWLTYFGVLATFYSVGWSVEYWSGITVMSALAGLGLAVLMTLAPAGDASVVAA